MGRTILAIGAHPDDYDLGCGGTLRKHILAGDDVHGIIVTRGQNGQHKDDMSEALLSSKILLKSEPIFLHFVDTQVPVDGEIAGVIERHIDRLKPDTIYTHTINDRHQDHRHVAYATRSASRKTGANILCYESPSAIPAMFRPVAFSVFPPSVMDEKLQALESYQSQIKKGIINLEWVRSQGTYWGFHALQNDGKGAVIAEAFEVARYIV